MNKKRIEKISEDIIRAIYREDIKYIENTVTLDNINYIDKDDRSFIFHAIISGNKPLVEFAIMREAQINLMDKLGWYPLHYAVQNYFIEITQLLIEHKAKIEAKDSYGNTALWRAVFASNGRGEIIKLLLKHGADPHNDNNSGISPYKLANTIANYNVKQFFD